MGALVYVTAWERKSWVRRIAAAFARVALLVVAITVLINLLGPPITMFFLARRIGKKMPGVNLVPRPLADAV